MSAKPQQPLTFEEKREMIHEDYWTGKISRERADEMLRVIEQQENAEWFEHKNPR